MCQVEIRLRNIARRQIVNYLGEMGKEVDPNQFEVDGVTVILLSEGFSPLGAIPIVEIDLLFEGKEPHLNQVVADFRQYFMRAGG